KATTIRAFSASVGVRAADVCAEAEGASPALAGAAAALKVRAASAASANDFICAPFSVADGEAGAGVTGRLDLIDHGDGVVGEGNAAVAVIVRQQGVVAQSEGPGAL